MESAGVHPPDQGMALQWQPGCLRGNWYKIPAVNASNNVSPTMSTSTQGNQQSIHTRNMENNCYSNLDQVPNCTLVQQNRMEDNTLMTKIDYQPTDNIYRGPDKSLSYKDNSLTERNAAGQFALRCVSDERYIQMNLNNETPYISQIVTDTQSSRSTASLFAGNTYKNHSSHNPAFQLPQASSEFGTQPHMTDLLSQRQQNLTGHVQQTRFSYDFSQPLNSTGYMRQNIFSSLYPRTHLEQNSQSSRYDQISGVEDFRQWASDSVQNMRNNNWNAANGLRPPHQLLPSPIFTQMRGGHNENMELSKNNTLYLSSNRHPESVKHNTHISNYYASVENSISITQTADIYASRENLPNVIQTRGVFTPAHLNLPPPAVPKSAASKKKRVRNKKKESSQPENNQETCSSSSIKNSDNSLLVTLLSHNTGNMAGYTNKASSTNMIGQNLSNQIAAPPDLINKGTMLPNMNPTNIPSIATLLPENNKQSYSNTPESNLTSQHSANMRHSFQPAPVSNETNAGNLTKVSFVTSSTSGKTFVMKSYASKLYTRNSANEPSPSILTDSENLTVHTFSSKSNTEEIPANENPLTMSSDNAERINVQQAYPSKHNMLKSASENPLFMMTDDAGSFNVLQSSSWKCNTEKSTNETLPAMLNSDNAGRSNVLQNYPYNARKSASENPIPITTSLDKTGGFNVSHIYTSMSSSTGSSANGNPLSVMTNSDNAGRFSVPQAYPSVCNTDTARSARENSLSIIKSSVNAKRVNALQTYPSAYNTGTVRSTSKNSISVMKSSGNAERLNALQTYPSEKVNALQIYPSVCNTGTAKSASENPVSVMKDLNNVGRFNVCHTYTPNSGRESAVNEDPLSVMRNSDIAQNLNVVQTTRCSMRNSLNGNPLSVMTSSNNADRLTAIPTCRLKCNTRNSSNGDPFSIARSDNAERLNILQTSTSKSSTGSSANGNPLSAMTSSDNVESINSLVTYRFNCNTANSSSGNPLPITRSDNTERFTTPHTYTYNSSTGNSANKNPLFDTRSDNSERFNALQSCTSMSSTENSSNGNPLSITRSDNAEKLQTCPSMGNTKNSANENSHSIMRSDDAERCNALQTYMYTTKCSTGNLANKNILSETRSHIAERLQTYPSMCNTENSTNEVPISMVMNSVSSKSSKVLQANASNCNTTLLASNTQGSNVASSQNDHSLCLPVSVEPSQAEDAYVQILSQYFFFKCSVCVKQVFSSHLSFLGHLELSHFGEETMKCTHCARTVKTCRLIAHMTAAHRENSDTMLPCGGLTGRWHCQVTTQWFADLKRHMALEHGSEKVFVCPLCEFSANTIGGYVGHLSSDAHSFMLPQEENNLSTTAFESNMRFNRSPEDSERTLTDVSESCDSLASPETLLDNLTYDSEKPLQIPWKNALFSFEENKGRMSLDESTHICVDQSANAQTFVDGFEPRTEVTEPINEADSSAKVENIRKDTTDIYLASGSSVEEIGPSLGSDSQSAAKENPTSESQLNSGVNQEVAAVIHDQRCEKTSNSLKAISAEDEALKLERSKGSVEGMFRILEQLLENVDTSKRKCEASPNNCVKSSDAKRKCMRTDATTPGSSWMPNGKNSKSKDESRTSWSIVAETFDGNKYKQSEKNNKCEQDSPILRDNQEFNSKEVKVLKDDKNRNISGRNENLQYQCIECDYKGTSLFQFKIHVAQHSSDSERLVPVFASAACPCCDTCGYYAADQKDFKVHKRRHDMENRFLCGYCSNDYHSYNDIGQHITKQHKGLPLLVFDRRSLYAKMLQETVKMIQLDPVVEITDIYPC